MIHWDYGWGMGFGSGWFSMIIFWVLLIVGIVYLLKIIAVSPKKGDPESIRDHGKLAEPWIVRSSRTMTGMAVCGQTLSNAR